MSRLPVLFAAHGSPMNAVESNGFTKALQAWGRRLPVPKAVLCVSAHGYGQGIKVSTSASPRTIHDFGGFPPELYEVRYPSPGHPGLAREALRLLAPTGAVPDPDAGLDHGAWSVLVHLYPKADVPVFQVSIDSRLPAKEHLALGSRLAPLREEGVLILGSGNVVHNLGRLSGRDAPPFPWASAFDEEVKDKALRGDRDGLIKGAVPSLSVPTPDHYLPLLYPLGAAGPEEPVSFPTDGFEHGAISLRSVQWGA